MITWTCAHCGRRVTTALPTMALSNLLNLPELPEDFTEADVQLELHFRCGYCGETTYVRLPATISTEEPEDA